MENYICHYGVKGMKWGIIRTPAQLGHKVASTVMRKTKRGLAKAGSVVKKGVEASREKEAKKKKRSIKDLTTEELQQRIDRLNMERTYHNMMAEQKNAQKSAARKFVEKQMGDLAGRVAKKAITKAVDKMFAEKGSTSILDMSKLDRYTDKELEAAKNRKDVTRDLLKNWERVSQTSASAFYGRDGYADLVAAGKGAVQEALKRMEERK